MQPNFEEESDDDIGFDLDVIEQQQNEADDLDLEASTLDLDEYKGSLEKKQADWWDVFKDVIIQPSLGAASAFTWPMDLLKLTSVMEGMNAVEELADDAKREGIPFDKEKYYKQVADVSSYIPTQDLMENMFEAKTEISLKPQSDTGKNIRKFFTLFTMLRGKGAAKSATGAILGTGTTQALRSAGAPEIVSELAGDVVGGVSASIEKSAREFTPEAKKLMEIAEKRGLPIFESMVRDEVPFISPKITEATSKRLLEELGLSTEEAIQKIISGELNVSRLQEAGVNIENLIENAYAKTSALAAENPQIIDTRSIAGEIKREIRNIKAQAPSPSNADKASLAILNKELKILKKAKPTSQQLINQHRNYNSNLKEIYKRPEFSGRENAVRTTYEKLKQSILNAMENQGQKDVVESLRNANDIFGQNAKMLRAEGLLGKAFPNGTYSPKALQKMLKSKQGNLLRRDLGPEAVREIEDVANFGRQAEQKTMEMAKRGRKQNLLTRWGPLAPLVLGWGKSVKGALLTGAKPMAQYVKGYLLSRPVTRTAYRNIIKNAAKGSFETLKADFDVINNAITEEFGDVDEFIKQGIQDIPLFDED